MSKFGFSRRRSALAAVLVSMCIGAPVVWGAGPAAALSSGCAGANVTSHTNQEIGTLTFEAGDQVSVTAADPHDGGTPTTVLIQVNTATVATAAYPGTASYTFPTAGTVVLAEGVDSGNADLTLTCVHPVTLPNAPTITSISAVSPDPAPVSVSVAFMSPDNGGGSDTASYQVTCMTTDGHFAATAVGPSSPIVVNGLAWGGSFECTVNVTNEMGPGPSSAPYQFVTGGTGDCRATLTAPTQVSSAPGNGSATVSWAPATSDPAGCIAGYVVTPSGGLPPTLVSGQGTTTVVHGLTNGATYTFSIAAETGLSVGPSSVSTSPIVAGGPTAATAVRASRIGTGVLQVRFAAANGNGAPVTRYNVTCRSWEGVRRSASGTRSPLIVKGLTPHRPYTCTVLAANSRGVSPYSTLSPATTS